MLKTKVAVMMTLVVEDKEGDIMMKVMEEKEVGVNKLKEIMMQMKNLELNMGMTHMSYQVLNFLHIDIIKGTHLKMMMINT